MSRNSTILHMLIGARLLHVASPEYRRKKAERKDRKALEKAEMNEMARNNPLSFVLLLLGAVCAIGILFFLFYPGVSAWWSLGCLLGLIVFFFLAVVAGINSNSDSVVTKSEEPHGEMVYAYEFLKRYKKYGCIPADVEFNLVNRTYDYVFVSENVIDACIAAEQKSLNK